LLKPLSVNMGSVVVVGILCGRNCVIPARSAYKDAHWHWARNPSSVSSVFSGLGVQHLLQFWRCQMQNFSSTSTTRCVCPGAALYVFVLLVGKPRRANTAAIPTTEGVSSSDPSLPSSMLLMSFVHCVLQFSGVGLLLLAGLSLCKFRSSDHVRSSFSTTNESHPKSSPCSGWAAMYYAHYYPSGFSLAQLARLKSRSRFWR
jgi:hypothetical protein